MIRLFVIIIFLLSGGNLQAQTIGGSSIYNVLTLPQHPLVAASGGRLVSSLSNEMGLILENPAFLVQEHNGLISSNFTSLSPGSTFVNAIGGYHSEKLNTNFALAVNHFSYGHTNQTDAVGNSIGSMIAYDQSVQLTSSHVYGKHWNYGLAIKYIISKYGMYSSQALVSDMGLNYTTEDKQMQMAFSIKNMGLQLKRYATQGEDLPFDLSIGVSKKLENAPFRFSVNAQKIHQFDILYNDTLFSNANGLSQIKNGFAGKLINHVILSGDILLGDKVVITLGYNFLKRKELSIQRMSNGLAGCSYGLTLHLKRMNFYFSRAHFQSSMAYLHAGITYNLKNN